MLNSLQACRAVAAILVVLHHANHSIFGLEKYFGHEPTGRWFAFAHASVDFFFVLCGFIMPYVHARDFDHPERLGSYLWSRFARIYPFYWVLLAAVLLVYFVVPQFGKGFECELDVVFRSILLIPHPQFHMSFGIAWTLVYEVFFYLLFGMLIVNKRFGIGAFVVWGTLVLAYACFDQYPWTYFFSHFHVRFLAGMVVWLILQRWQIPRPRLVAGFGAMLFLGAGMVECFYVPLTAHEQAFCYTVSSAITLLGLVEADRSGLVHCPGWLVYLGNASYSIYLVHFLPLSAFAKIAKAMHLDGYMPLIVLYLLHVGVAIGVGCLCHQFIEHPLHRWSKKFFRRPNPAPAVAPHEHDALRAA